MAVTSIPNPYPDQILDVVWPLIAAVQNGSAFQQNGNPRYGLGSGYGVFSAATGAATNNMGVYKTLIGGQFTSDGAGATVERTLDGFSCPLMLTAPVGASGTLAMPEQGRIYGLTCLWAQAAAVNYSSQSGICLEPANAAAPGWIDTGNRGMGIVGDGAGGWLYVEKDAGGVGVYQFSQALTWPVAVSEWARVDMVCYGATATSNARFELWLNGVITIARTWGAVGVHLPFYTTVANAARFVPHVRCGEPALAGQLNIAALRWQAGKFNPVTGAAV